MAKIKLCEVCGNEFLCKTSAKVCSDECRKIASQKASRKSYEKSRLRYTCIKCGKEKFTKTPPTDNLCRHCRENHYQYKHETIQKTLCKHCLKVLGSKIINVTRPDCEHIIWKVCDECNHVNYQLSSQRMKLNNPSYFGKTYSEEEYRAKKEAEAAQVAYRKSPEYKQFIRSKVSQRMRQLNPMFNEETRMKVSRTAKENIASGATKIRRGIHNACWKGNNNYVRNVLRRSIKFWRIANLERANYTCERCGKTNCELHIHHKHSFFDIVNECAEKLQLNIKELLVVSPTTNDYSEDFLKLEKEVINYHETNSDLGIVVCLDCHDIIDPQFKKPHRKKIKDENKETIERIL